MMQSRQDGNGDNDTGPLDCSMQGASYVIPSACEPDCNMPALKKLVQPKLYCERMELGIG